MEPADPTATLNIDDAPAMDLVGTRFVMIAFHDQQLQESLHEAGAEHVGSDHGELNWVIVESASVDLDDLPQQLGDDLVERLTAGEVQLLERQQVQRLLGDTSQVRRLYTIAMLADLLTVPVATIRGWHRRGLIQPVNSINKLAYFDFNEVLTAKQLATLVALGVQPNSIQKSLDQMARWLPESDRSLSRVSMLVDGHRLLLRRGGQLVEPGGQQRFNFDESDSKATTNGSGLKVVGGETWEHDHDADDAASMILPFDPIEPIVDPEKLTDQPLSSAAMLRLAERLEEQGDLSDAIETYRSLLLATGPTAETCLRLGELLYRSGQVQAARERYCMAIELDPQLVEARAALGCVLSELGETELAIAAFQGALSEHPHYTDVHFQLARAYQSIAQDEQALAHWQRFLQLDPDGLWAEEARTQVAELLGH